jgi:hypothetical protein
VFGILELASLYKIVNVFDGWVSWWDPLLVCLVIFPSSLWAFHIIIWVVEEGWLGLLRVMIKKKKEKKKPCRSFNYFVHVKIGIVVFASHCHRWILMENGIKYLTLRLVSSSKNPQNSEMNFLVKVSYHVENHHNYHIIGYILNNLTTHITILKINYGRRKYIYNLLF